MQIFELLEFTKFHLMKAFFYVSFALLLVLFYNPIAHADNNDKSKSSKKSDETKGENKDQADAIVIHEIDFSSFTVPDNRPSNLDNAESIAYYYICTHLTKPEKISKEEARVLEKQEKEIIKREKKAARKLRKEIDKDLTLQY